MALTEFAHVTLKPTLSPAAIPEAFYTEWRSALRGVSAASRSRFALYGAVDDARQLYLIGGWRDAEEHARFLASEAAGALAKGIARYVDMVGVRHVECDISEVLRGIVGGEEGVLRVDVLRRVGEGKKEGFDQGEGGGGGGGHVSHRAQAGGNKEAFERMRREVGVVVAKEEEGDEVGGEVEGRTWVHFTREDGDAANGAGSGGVQLAGVSTVRLRLFLDVGEDVGGGVGV